MNEETVNQEQQTAETQGSKTFTQEEVNAMIGERVGRLNAKYADYETLKDKAAKFDAAEEAGKTELQKANDRAAALQAELDGLKKAESVRALREKIAGEKKIPANLLTGDTEEACRAQADAIIAYAGQSGYPKVRDGGEVPSKTDGSKTRDQFANWLKENL